MVHPTVSVSSVSITDCRTEPAAPAAGAHGDLTPEPVAILCATESQGNERDRPAQPQTPEVER